MTVITIDGSTDILYIRQVEGTSEYSINQTGWSSLTWPLTINNDNGSPSDNILKVLFTTDLILTDVNEYITINTDGIQIGDTSLKTDGTKYTITIDGVTNYEGFVRNQYSYVYLYNLSILVINGSTLSENCGWVGGSSYGSGSISNYIIGCESNGAISAYGGGIVGGEAATVVGDTTPSLTIIGCISSGNIGNGGGGIAGQYCGQGSGSTVTISQCSSSGNISDGGGGIVGQISGQGGASCIIEKCFSTGTIGSYAGGIAGANAGSGGYTSVQKCYTFTYGGIGEDGGGIFGRYAASDGGATNATNCYTLGSSIYGMGAAETATSSNCYIANGSWSDIDANTTLASVSTVWFSTGTANTPYLVRNFGYTPYSLQNIVDNTLIGNYNQNVTVGNTTVSSVLSISPVSYSIISGGDASITINSETGVISVSETTPPNEYLLEILVLTLTTYSHTIFGLTVLEAPLPTPSIAGVLETKGKQFNMNDYTTLQEGQRFVVERIERPNLRFNSFADYNKYLIAQSAFRR